MSKTYNTTDDIRAAIHALNESDIIEVPQYANALEVEYLGELNGEANAFVGVRFADESKRTSANKTIILNKHSGTAYLSAGTTDKGAVTELTVVSGEAAEDADEDEAADHTGVEETVSGTSALEDADEPESEPESFEEEYRDAVDTAAAGIVEDVFDDLGEDFQHVTLSDMPMVAAESIEETLEFHEFVTESHNHLDVLQASEKDPDDYEWAIYADLDAPAGQSASNVLAAMAYVVFRADIEDALRGEC